jgi:predicted nucleotidyltransferase
MLAAANASCCNACLGRGQIAIVLNIAEHVKEPAWSKMRAKRPRGPSPSVADPRRALLLAVHSFVRAARACPGVQRISLLGSLVTAKAIPKDVDILVAIDSTTDLSELARAGRRLMGLLRPSTSVLTSSSPMRLGGTLAASAIIANAIHVRHASPSIVGVGNTLMTTFMSSRCQKNCLPYRPLTFGRTLSGASRYRLMSRKYC